MALGIPAVLDQIKRLERLLDSYASVSVEEYGLWDLADVHKNYWALLSRVCLLYQEIAGSSEGHHNEYKEALERFISERREKRLECIRMGMSARVLQRFIRRAKNLPVSGYF